MAGRAGRLRSLALLAVCTMLAACGAARQAIEEQTDPPPANLNDALAECRNAFPDQIAQAVRRAACVIKATDLVRPLLPFPELLDQENALRKSLADQVQGGKISLLERNTQIQSLHSKIVDEEQSRLHAAPADAAKPADTEKQSTAAMQWRLSNPETCGRLGGNSANCY